MRAPGSRSSVWLVAAALTITFLGAAEGAGMSLVATAAASDTHDFALYPYTYTFFMLASVLGIVLTPANTACNGPGRAGFLVSVVLSCFLGGLALATSGSMVAFLAGRVLQGYAAGAVTVIVFAWAAAHPQAGGRRSLLASIGGAGALGAALGSLIIGAATAALGWRTTSAGLAVVVTAATVVFVARLDRSGPIPRQRSRLTPATLLRGGFWACLLTAVCAANLVAVSGRHALAVFMLVGVAIAASGVALMGRVRHGARSIEAVLPLAALVAAWAVANYALAEELGVSYGVLAAAFVLGAAALGWAGAAIVGSRVDLHLTVRRAAALAGTSLVVIALMSVMPLPWWLLIPVSAALGVLFEQGIVPAQTRLFERSRVAPTLLAATLQVGVSSLGAWFMTMSSTIANSAAAEGLPFASLLFAGALVVSATIFAGLLARQVGHLLGVAPQHLRTVHQGPREMVATPHQDPASWD